MAKWDVRIYGKLPQMLELDADTKEEAENEALNEIYSGLEIEVVAQEPQKPFLVENPKASRR